MNTYRLAKRKEEALKKLNDENISIFCGEDNPEKLNFNQINEKIRKQ